MISPHIELSQIDRLRINKVVTDITGIASFALAASILLWRGGICIPDQRIYAVIFGAACRGLYFAVIVSLLRLRRKQLAAPPRGSDCSEGPADAT
jgi:hypothetical protein